MIFKVPWEEKLSLFVSKVDGLNPKYHIVIIELGFSLGDFREVTSTIVFGNGARLIGN